MGEWLHQKERTGLSTGWENRKTALFKKQNICKNIEPGEKKCKVALGLFFSFWYLSISTCLVAQLVSYTLSIAESIRDTVYLE